MASTTPNIGLTLPTGAEKVSRQIINTNNTLIDTAIGTLNSKIIPKQAETTGTENGFMLNNITGSVEFGVNNDGNGFYFRYYVGTVSYRLVLQTDHGYVQKYDNGWNTWKTLY